MRRFIFTVVAFLLIAVYALGQETRSTLTGLVSDPTGAVVPNATINIINMDTGAKMLVKSTSQGAYTAPFLAPGAYNISVQMAGFKSYLHTGVVLQAQATVTENIILQVGDISESITVTAATPLVDTANADTGQSLTPEEVQDLPNNGRSPLGLARNEYGAIPNGKYATAQITPTANSTASNFSLGGGQSASNELLLNGIPDMESTGRTVSFNPQLDSVDTVHVDEFSANAALGDTTGGTVNITTKSGTNQLHGTVVEYYNGSRPFEALPYFTAKGATVSSSHYNQDGATVGGPVVIPHLFNGRNRLFFFYAFEGYNSNNSSPTISSVPTQDERNGDFHALLSADGTSGQLYDPYYDSGTTSTGYQTISGKQYWIRAAIPNNCITGTTSYCSANGYSPDTQLSLSTIANAYLKYLPLPNYNGSSTKADGENNYINYPPNSNNYKSHMVRIDWNINDSDKLFAEFHRSHYVNLLDDYYSNSAISGKTEIYTQPGGEVDNIKSFSPSLSLETRLGFARYAAVVNPSNIGTNPSNFGFPGYIASNSNEWATPYVSFSDGATIEPFSQKPSGYGYNDNLQLYISLNKTWRRHSFKAGTDVRTWKKSGFSPTAADGNFSFSSSKTSFLSQSPNYAADEIAQPFGSSFALFELGLPSSGTYTMTQRFQYDNWYSAYFLQDDWKALHNLTFSLGLRLDHETAVVESNNRMIQNWYPNKENTATAGATSAYGSQYSADVAALAKYNASYLPSTSNFQPTGASVYETPGNRYPYHPAPLYVSPRIGFAYAPSRYNGTLVIRGGFAILNSPFGTYMANSTTGYSQSTSMETTISSVNGGYTPITTWEDAYPTSSSAANYNPIAQILGSTMGADASLGSSIMFFQDKVKVPYSEKSSFDIQKQLGHNWMLEIGYMHVLSLHNSFSPTVSSSPYYAYLDHTPNANSASALAVSNDMAAKVTNPFYGLFPSFTTSSGAKVANTTSLNTNSTVAVSSLLQNYPEFSSVTEYYVPSSTVNFNALMARLNKHMSNGLEFNVNFEHSRQLGTLVQLNSGGPLWYGETTSDYPNHLAVTAIYELPFGRGRKFMNNADELIDSALGGWRVSGAYQYLSGQPLTWSNVNYSGNFNSFNNRPHYTAGPSFNTNDFDKVSADQPGSWNYRTFPEYLLRSDPTNNFDFSVLKEFKLQERIVLQFRADAFNALNHAQMSTANVTPTSSSFAYITSQANTNRKLAGGLHLRF